MIDPWWPLVALAVVQAGDAVLCLRRVPFVAQCLEDVKFPRRYWWTLPLIKGAAAAGLIVGIWVEWLAILTSGALVLYFLVAITMHARANDFGRNLFLNCAAMTLLCIGVFGYVLASW